MQLGFADVKSRSADVKFRSTDVKFRSADGPSRLRFEGSHLRFFAPDETKAPITQVKPCGYAG